MVNVGVRVSKIKQQKSSIPTVYDVARMFALNATMSFSLPAVVRECGYKKKAAYYIEEIVGELEHLGIIENNAGYCLHKDVVFVKGSLSFSRAGASFCSNPKGEDIFIPQEARLGASNNDIVDVLVIRKATKDKKAEGCVISIRKRATGVIVAKAVQKVSLTSFLFMPLNCDISMRFLITFEEEKDIPYNIFSLVYSITKEDEHKNTIWNASIVECLGREDCVSTQEKIVKAEYALPQEFSDAVMEEVTAITKDVDIKQYSHRKDLRSLPFVTIDGEDSRDFDDAIYVEKTNKGYTLYVAIADVTEYVRKESELDKESQSRSNSYYFPTTVIPMLPKELSNGICSLNPGVPRLVVVVEMNIDSSGIVQQTELYEGIITSHARLTYSQVQHYFDTVKANETTNTISEKVSSKQNDNNSTDKQESEQNEEKEKIINIESEEIQAMLDRANVVVDSLHKQRRERGALFFKTSSPYFTIEEDAVRSVKPYPHYYSHLLIEECMLIANESVASLLTQEGLAVVYRTHASPAEDKIETLREYTSYLFPKQKLPRATDPHFLQNLLCIVEGTPQESIFHSVAIRSMMQARYSLEHEEHYGLQSQTYCHFTSPIRRYADCLIHYSVKYYLHKEEQWLVPLETMLSAIEIMNKNERIGMNAEREIHKRLGVLYMRQYVGMECKAVVSGISNHALYVEFPEYGVSGIILLSSLQDDYYEVLEKQQRVQGRRTKKTYAMGDILDVHIVRASLEDKEVQCVIKDERYRNNTRTNRKKIIANIVRAKASALKRKEASSQRKGAKGSRKRSKKRNTNK